VLLTLQNVDGGWATYENNRGYGWYEWLNPSEVFGDIMIDYSCTHHHCHPPPPPLFPPPPPPLPSPAVLICMCTCRRVCCTRVFLCLCLCVSARDADVECSMASLSAVYMFHQHFPTHRTREVRAAIAAGRRFIKSIQRADGSWYGSWGCCFTCARPAASNRPHMRRSACQAASLVEGLSMRLDGVYTSL
jgi:hypothetical protein